MTTGKNLTDSLGRGFQSPIPMFRHRLLQVIRIHVHTRHKLYPLCTSLFQMFVEVAEDGGLFAFAAVVASVEELSAERT